MKCQVTAHRLDPRTGFEAKFDLANGLRLARPMAFFSLAVFIFGASLPFAIAQTLTRVTPSSMSRWAADGGGNKGSTSADNIKAEVASSGNASLPQCSDPTSLECGPPILFAHGICDHPSSWGQVAGSIATYLQTNYGNLYPNSTMYIGVAQGPTIDDVIFFDGSGNILSSPPPSNARIFSIAFYDPDCPYCSPQDFNIENVMNVSVFQKGDELALVIAKIKQITGAPKVMLIGHSMGGVDARSYLENLGLFGSHKPGNDTDVVALTTIDTPHLGSPLADLSAIAPSGDSPGDLLYCMGEPSTNIYDLVPGFPTMQDLNYQSGRASDIPSTVSFDSMVNYVPQTLSNFLYYPYTVYGIFDLEFEAKGQGDLNDGAVSRYSQNLPNALTSYPTSYTRPNVTSHDIPFAGSLTGACGFPHVLHELPCVGNQSNIWTQLETDITSNLLKNTITLSPASVDLNTGQTQQFSATQNNSSPSVFWTILEDPASLTIDNYGLFTAGSPGVFHLVATDTATGKQYGMATVTVNPTPQSSTLEVNIGGSGTGGVTSSPQGISCRTTCSYAFPSNTSVVLTALPDQGMVVSAWNGCDTQSINNCTVSMAEGKTVSLTFSTEQSNELLAPNLNAVQITGSAASPVGSFSWSQVLHNSGYRILVSNQRSALPIDPNSYICSPSCLINNTVATNSPTFTSNAGTLVPGTTYFWQVHALAGTGYSPGVWSNVGTFSTSASPSQVQVTMQGSGTGTVTSSPSGVNCPGVCSASFAANTSVTLSESAASGSQFVQWGGACVGSSCTLTAAGVQTVSANFNLNANYTLTVGVSGTGSVSSADGKINCSNSGGSCVASYPSGTLVTLNGTPGANYTLGGWSGACGGNGGCSLTMTQNQEVLAAFDVSSQPNGQLLVNAPSFAPVFNQGTSPASIGLTVNSSTGAPMLGNAVASEQSGGAWITIDGHASETWAAPVTLVITFNPAGLSPGIYNGAITLTSSQATNSPVVVPVTLTVSAPLIITSPTALPDAFSGKPYSTTLQASGGTGLTWTMEQGTLPTGLTLNSSTGVISGTPGNISGIDPLTLNIQVTDSSSRLAWQAFSMNWRQGVSVMLWDNSLLNMTVGSPLYQTAGTNFVASGGTPPYTWSATGLPAGVSLSSTGAFSGSPTALGQYDIVLTATDSTGLSGSLPLTVTTNELLLQIYDSQNRTPPLLTPIVAGTSIGASYYMLAQGGTQTGYTWTVEGTLPPGITSGPPAGCNTTCALDFSGTPTTAGTYAFVVRVTDSQSNSTTTSQTWIVNPNANGPKIGATTLAQATIGQSYSQQLVASGGVAPLTWKVLSGNLDPQLSLTGSGSLSGTASAPNECPNGPGYAPRGAVPTSFVVEVTDANAESDVQQLCLTSYFPQPTLSSVSPQNVVPDGSPKTLTVTGTNFQALSQLWVEYTQQPTVYVSPTQLQVTLQPGTAALFNLVGSGGGLVSGNWPIRVQAPYTLPSSLSSFNIDEAPPQVNSVQATYGSTGDAPCTPNFSCQFAIGGTGFSYETTFQVAGSSQSISRLQVPTTTQPWAQITAGYFDPPQTGSYTINVTNPNQPGGGSATASGTFQVYNDGATVATPSSFAPNFTQGAAGSSTGLLVQVAGIPNGQGTATVSTQSGGNWLTVGGQLSGSWTAGQTLNVSFNPAGLSPGNYSGSITLNLTNVTGGTGLTVPVTMTVLAPLSILTASNLPLATDGQTYSTTIAESGGTGLVWSLVAGALPAGLVLTPNTGTISGSPTVPGGAAMVSFTIGLQDSIGRFISRVFSMTVDSPPSIGTQPISQTVAVGAAATFSVAASGTPTPTYQWQYLSGSTWVPFTNGTGTTSATLITNAATAAESGLQLRVVVSNGVGSPATSNVVTLTVNGITPTVTVTPSASSITTAQPLTVTVAVNGGTGNPTPTGTVTLTGGGYTSPAATLSSGSATLNIPANSLSAGTDSLVASYTPDSSGSSTYNSASGSVTVTVTNPAKTTPTVTVTPSASSITTAQPLTVTVAVNGGTGNPTPTGTVILSSGSYSAQQTLASGTASFTIAAGTLGNGANTLTASYSGDTTYTVASSTSIVTVEPVSISATTPSPVNPGSSTTSTLTLTGSSGYSGTMNLNCSLTNSPAGAQSLPTCTLNPSSVTLASGGSGTSTFTVNTTAASTAALARPTDQHLWKLGGGGGAVLAAFLFFGIPFRRRRWTSMLALLLLVAVAGVIGCGGGGGTSGGGGGGSSTPATTAGNYSFTVAATDSANAKITASTTISVTVQ